MLRKIIKVVPCIVLISILFILHQSNYEGGTATEELFEEADLEVLKQFENQTIQIGYIAGDGQIAMDSLVEIMRDEFSINLEFIQYNSHAELEEYVIQGEVDALMSLSNSNEREGLDYVYTMVTSNRIVVTNIHNSLNDMTKLESSKVGFLSESNLYKEFQNIVTEDSFEIYFFDTVDKALTALENQEVDAFIARESNKEALITRENLQIEFAFQDEIMNIQLATAKEDIYLFLKTAYGIHQLTQGEKINGKIVFRDLYFIEKKIREYIQEKYQSIIEMYETIEVGMHNANFPYSYFEVDGTAAGVYIEMLELFQSATGIQYNIRNDLDNTNFVNLLDGLADNNIQFLLGLTYEGMREEILEVGMLEVQDNIISIVKYEDDEIDTKNLDEIHFGAVITMESSAAQILGGHEYTEFESYKLGIEALIDGEIDILLGTKSVLAYYQNVQGNLSLTQTNLINKMCTHSILGNVDNQGLNDIMAEIKRLYYILHTEDQEMRWSNQEIDYHSKYAELQNQQEKINTLAIASFSGVIIIIIIHILLKKRRENRRLKQQSEIDKLTGLYNRNTYEEKCKELINKYPNMLGIFFFIDLNDFKYVNDTYGHTAGDDVLTQFGEALKKFEDKNTISFRIAGDEFGICKMGCQNLIEIFQMIQEIRVNLPCEVVIENNITIPIKYSAGSSIYNIDTKDFDTLIEYADFAMYEAKKNKGRGSALVLFDADRHRSYKKMKLIKEAVGTVIREKQLYAVYQPICYLDDGKVYGYEGLSRTTNPAFSNIIELIKAAEMDNKSNELDLLMMEQVISNFKGEGKVFINAEGKSKEAIEEFIEKMLQAAKEASISEEDIVLELSERKNWNPESLCKMRDYAKKYKFHLAIDDFGVGFSNIPLLLELEPDIVKVDNYFVHEIHKDVKKQLFIKAFLEYARSNNVKVICEGIEAKEELEVLKNLGGDYGQGYYLGKPK